MSRYSGVLYRLRNFVEKSTLFMLYYSLIQSRLQYGITLWGNATKMNLQEIKVRQNTIIRIIARSNRYEALSNLYKSLNFLKLDDI